MEEKKENNEEGQQEKAPEDPVQQKKIKDSVFIYSAAFIIIALLLIIFIPRLISPSVISVDELHKKNIEGKLALDKGYMYQGSYSFVLYDNLWYTQLSTSKKLFNIPFHFSPRDLESITPIGVLNRAALDEYANFFITFDPTDEGLNYIGVSVGETDAVLINVFGKGVIPSCINNESKACDGRPIVQCNSTDAPVFYFASENETQVLYLNNCIIVTGRGDELFKATDRMLFDLLGIMS